MNVVHLFRQIMGFACVKVKNELTKFSNNIV